MPGLTTTTDITNTIQTYFDRVLLDTLDPTLRFYQFAEKKSLPKNSGNAVRWNRVSKFGMGRILSEGVAVTVSAGTQLSTVAVSAIVNQYGEWVNISDVADWASIMDVGKASVERLAASMALTIDRVTANAIINHVSATGASGHFLFKTSTELTDYWGMTSTISAGVMTVSATNVLAVSDIRQAIFQLRSLSVKPYSGQDYIGILTTEQMDDIAGDSTFISFHQYVDKGVDALYNGEMGKVYGCRLIEAPTGPAVRGSNAGGTASTIAYGAVIFGKGFFGAVDFLDGMQTYFDDKPSKSDILNQTKVYGYKASFAAKVLNTSCGITIFTGSRDTTTADAESANSGLRHEDPSAY